MNWLERVENIKLQIRTGDGQTYSPLWRAKTSREVTYNTQIYDFVDVKGSYVDRKLPSGMRYEISLIFQGEDCIEQAAAFLQSAENTSPWQVTHPFYDEILVQPLSLKQENIDLNVSRIVGEVVETIETKYPQSQRDEKRYIESLKSDIDKINLEAFPDVVGNNQIQAATDTVEAVEKAYKDYDIQNIIQTAYNAAQNISTDASAYMQRMTDLINYPLQLEQKIERRIDVMVEAFENLKNTSPVLLQANGALIVSAAFTAAVMTQDYVTRTNVYDVIAKISNLYENYIIDLQDAENFTPDEQIASRLEIIAATTVGELYNIALEAKQERVKVLDIESNIISVTHELYGFSENNLTDLIEQNSLSGDELIILPRDKEIIYYV